MATDMEERQTYDRSDVDAAREALDAASGGDSEQKKVDDGAFMQLVGGKAPTTNKVRLYGGAIEVEPPEGGFVKGATYVFRLEAMCHKAGFTDEIDGKTQQVVGCSDERGLKIRAIALVV